MVDEESTLSEQITPQTLKSAIRAARAGQRAEAHRLLQQVVASDPSSSMAWLWLAGVADGPDEALAALSRVEQLNPDHPRLEAARRWAQAGHPQGSQPAPSTGAASDSPTQPAGPLADATQPVVPGGQPAPAGHSPQARWPRGWWAVPAGLGALLLSMLLIGLIRIQAGSAQARLPAPPTPVKAERVQSLQPELNAALAASRWEDAVAVLQVMRALDPDNPALKRQSADVYYQLALRRRDRGDFPGALAALDEALALAPDDPGVQKEHRLLEAYHQGTAYHQSGDWQNAIRTLVVVHLEDPAYLHVAELLYSAYYNLGLSQQAAGDLVAAQASYQAAVKLLPEEPLARQKVDEVAVLLQPPTPTPTPAPTPTPDAKPQRIVVDVSEQRMYVYEGEEVRWEWVTSTGEPGRPTAIGHFAVQSKIPMAYASTWNLDMPHWLGIYWSGPLENGIHALPVKRDTGYKLWDGFLGQRVSYGCVILSDENAETLYDWVKIGTPVIIQP
jgi:tetratricopeptide (TPR) repeat protein